MQSELDKIPDEPANETQYDGTFDEEKNLQNSKLEGNKVEKVVKDLLVKTPLNISSKLMKPVRRRDKS